MYFLCGHCPASNSMPCIKLMVFSPVSYSCHVIKVIFIVIRGKLHFNYTLNQMLYLKFIQKKKKRKNVMYAYHNKVSKELKSSTEV